MKNLLKYIQSRVSLAQADIDLIQEHFVSEEVPSQTNLLNAGRVAQYLYFLDRGTVKGYQNTDGKTVVQHLIAEGNLFTSPDSFTAATPSGDYYETITDCRLLKISRPDFGTLQQRSERWRVFVEDVTHEHLRCKLERVRDFQTLTAKERYIKFVNQHPQLALRVSVDNVASFLGMEPQSLSRIRRQVTF